MPEFHQSRVVKAAPFWPSSPHVMDRTSLDMLHTFFDFVKMEWPARDVSNISGSHPHLTYLAGEEETQALTFAGLLERPDLDILWAVRGGYGALRWASRILKTTHIHEKIPMILGFSDVSFLHLAMFKLDKKGIHGPMIATLKTTSKESIYALKAALKDMTFPALRGTPYRDGRARGRLLPVNLSCLAASLRTPLEPDLETSPVILALEDHNEPVYRIDRLLTQLREAEVLGKVRGIAMGRLMLRETEEKMKLQYLMKELLGPLNCPVVLDLPFGHGPDNMPLLVGEDYFLDGDSGVLMKC